VRRVWGGIAAAVLAASLAAAEDQAAAPGADADAKVGPRLLLFSGTDFWRNGTFLHGGLIWSPGGLYQEGFTLKALVSGGTYRYGSGEPPIEIDGRQLAGFVLAGWRFKYDHMEANVLVGPDAQDYKLKPDDHGSRLRGRYYGVRAGVDLWYEPSPGVMTALNTSASTAGSDFSVRGAVGWLLFDRLYVGPEAEGLGSVGYRQLRVGLHGTGLKLGTFEWSAGGGWADDSDHRAGAYGHVGVLTRY
jgi:hypothetical protein